MKHKIIKVRIKEDRVALTCVEMLDRSMKMGKEMTTALVEWNRQHFQQPQRNGATSANGEAFRKACDHSRRQSKSYTTIPGQF